MRKPDNDQIVDLKMTDEDTCADERVIDSRLFSASVHTPDLPACYAVISGLKFD